VRAAAALVAAALLALAGLVPSVPARAADAPTAASGSGRRPDPGRPSALRPPAPRLDPARATAIALRDPKLRAERASHRGSYGYATREGGRWKVDLWTRKGSQIGTAYVDDATGAVTEAWTGYQVAWTMARGYPGAFGRRVSALWVWLPLCALFLVPWIPTGRGRRARLLHLDLLVLVGGTSAAFAAFNSARIDLMVPILFPCLAYLLARMLRLGFRRAPAGGPRDPWRPLVPLPWLAVGLVFLVGFRVGLNVVDSNVIDVGHASVVGADRLLRGERVYGGFPKGLERGDTYGPVTYEAYAPFVAVLGAGRPDDLPAAHAAAIAFDLLTLLGLFWLGRMVRGPATGLLLAWSWATFPFTLFVANSNANDSLVALLLTCALLAAARPAARGAAVAAAGLAKIAPLALAPLLARAPGRGWRGRDLGLYALGFAVVALLAMAPFTGDPLAVWRRTVGFQDARDAPFSPWGLYGWPDGIRTGVQAATVALALALAFVPRRRDLAQVAALGAAVLIALQLGVVYWFFPYLVWLVPFALAAIVLRFAPEERPAPARVADRAVRDRPAPAPGRARSRRPASAPSSG